MTCVRAIALLVSLGLIMATSPQPRLARDSEIVLGDVRVQALSPTLIRVEPRGALGFEDRTTFVVQDRTFLGIPVSKKNESTRGTWLTTDYYDVFVSTGKTRFGPDFVITCKNGTTLFTAQSSAPRLGKLLWPAPMQDSSYAMIDYPRFFVPEWSVSPIPPGAHVDSALAATHGYDFRNNVQGDTYIFLLGSTMDTWSASRLEFLRLTGPCPLLPDYAYGTWFTYWNPYSEASAKDDIAQWEGLQLPIDIWGMDMNWRNISRHCNPAEADKCMDWFYDYPATNLFPNYTEWFAYLKEHKLRTYFNDHPYPVAARNQGGLQTSPEETAFRWQGLSEYMAKGLTFWWYDRNWWFSIPPPMVNLTNHGGNYDGLYNFEWGSHVYYSSVAAFDKNVRDQQKDTFYGRPMALTKFDGDDWRAGKDPSAGATNPSQHRYPVWWTGDGVDLQASVEAMVDSGLHHFKPFVHSDCGGDGRGSAGDLLRWTAHCVFGSILRFHGADHRAWTYDNHTVDTVRNYLNIRYKLLPSLISAGATATATAFPLVARGDFFWPELEESRTNQQYIFLNDTLVAPIWNSSQNQTMRDVWIPPGSWQDAWSGSIVSGPKKITVTQPFERIPMWHRRDGGLVLLSNSPALRVEDQDWSSLTVDLFPSAGALETTRSLVERDTAARTELRFSTDDGGRALLRISASESGTARAWVARLHLHQGQRVRRATIDGKAVEVPRHIQATTAQSYLPFQGAGAAPAAGAGPVVELSLPAGASDRVVMMDIESGLLTV